MIAGYRQHGIGVHTGCALLVAFLQEEP